MNQRDPYPLTGGINFRPRERLAPEALCAVLAGTVSFLQRFGPTLRLRRFEDWLQHDGLMFERGETSFGDVLRWARTPRALLAAMKEDHEVRVGVAPAPGQSAGPASEGWYLRFILEMDPDETHPEGEFDLTLPPALADAYRREVVAASPFPFVEEDAAMYYLRINCG